MAERPAAPRTVLLSSLASVAALAALVGALLAGASAPLAAQWSSDAFRAMEARNIGPAGMSGRVTAVDVDPTDRNRIFVGSASGGLWLSEDGAVTWEPIFDDQPLQSIGHVAVSPANPDLVWVGTGEGNPRQSVSVGDGVYRSRDGGRTWTHVGLGDSERIHRVIPHPTDPDVAYVGAMGRLWSDGGQRGLYRTTDGGETWERLLHVDERTGVGDMVMDPRNPDKLFVAMYDHRRWPWFFESGGHGSGLYVTRDGGESWTELGPEHGIPEKPLGRIGLAVAAGSPDVVYALVQAERNAMLRSDDGGRTWRTVSDERGISPRPMYYSDLRVDPQNENRVYRLAGTTDVSEDGGRTWETTVPSRIIHGDVHELWIDPDDPRHLIMGNDGGIGISHDRGGKWRFVENLPLAQFYQVHVDMDVPFNVYGGVQDSGSWLGPSNVWHDRGIVNAHWRRVNGADGFATMPDRSNPRYGYTTSQNGRLIRFDRETMERPTIQPVHPEGEELRFNWNAALADDPHDPSTIYFGSQYVHRSTDAGSDWEIISPDLTTAVPSKYDPEPVGAPLSTETDQNNTILAIDASPLDPGVIWAVTDDGNVQVTRDDGASWTNVADRLPDAPDSAYVPEVKASNHEPGRAYVVVDDHRRGDMNPYAYRTDDYGESWERLGTDRVTGFLHEVEEDPVHPDLVLLGGEQGMYVSLDRGESFLPWTHGVPNAPVRELIVHPRDHDLVIGTHGRAIWILDDVRPLRALAARPDLAGEEVHAFDPPPARQHEVALEGDLGIHQGYRVVGHQMYFGEKRPYGAILSYWIGGGAAEAGPAEIEIRSADDDRVVREMTGPVEPGVNRVVWDLRFGGVWTGAGEEAFQPSPPEVLPGSYRVTVRVGERESSAPLRVRRDPRPEYALEDHEAKLAALREAGRWLALAQQARDRLSRTGDGVQEVFAGLEEVGSDDGLREHARELSDTLEAVEERLFSGGDAPYRDVSQAYRALSGSNRAPTPNDRTLMEHARRGVEEIVDVTNRTFEGPAAEFRRALSSEGYTPFPRWETLRIAGGR